MERSKDRDLVGKGPWRVPLGEGLFNKKALR